METYFNNMVGDEGKDKLLHDLIVLVHDAEDLVKTAGQELGDKSRDELMDDLKRVKATCQKLEEQAVASVGSIDKLVRRHPYSGMGIAFAAGLVVGVLFNSGFSGGDEDESG